MIEIKTLSQDKEASASSESGCNDSQNFPYISQSTEGQSWSEFLNLKDTESVFFKNRISQHPIVDLFSKSMIL